MSLLSSNANTLSLLINRIDTSEWPVVKVYVSVIDPYCNKPIIGMVPGNFTVDINGVRQTPQVDQASAVDMPISLGMVLDRSGSMDGQALTDLQSAATTFVQQLKTDDEAEIVSLGDNVSVDQGFTNDKTALLNAINQLSAWGGTPLFDAVWQSISDTATRTKPRKTLIVMTDGGENASSTDHGGGYTTDVQIPIGFAKQQNITVYTIGLNGSDFTRSAGTPITQTGQTNRIKSDVGPSRAAVTSSRSTRSAESDLQQLALYTGGEYFFCPSSETLVNIYNQIRIRTQQQYVLTVHVNDASSDTCSADITASQSGLNGQASGTSGVPTLVFPVANYSLGAGFGLGIDDRTAYLVDTNNVAYVHVGQDLLIPQNTPVNAIADGTVIDQSMTLSSYGGTSGQKGGAMLVRHTAADGRLFYAVYGHIKPLTDGGTLPAVNSQVFKGKPFVRVGPYVGGREHLHLGIHPGAPEATPYQFRGRTVRDDSNPNATDLHGWIDPMPVLNNGTW